MGMDEIEKDVREAIAKIECTFDYLKAFKQGELDPYLARKYDLNESAWLQAIINIILDRPMSKLLADYVEPIIEAEAE